MLVSIIITTRDEDPRMLEATLAGIARTTRHVATDVIVVDDGSITPVTANNARVLRNPQPAGVCESRRMGALLAKGDWLIWLDAHMSFGEHWLEQLLVHATPTTLVCSPFWTYDLKDCMCWGADFAWNATRNYHAGKYPGF